MIALHNIPCYNIVAIVYYFQIVIKDIPFITCEEAWVFLTGFDLDTVLYGGMKIFMMYLCHFDIFICTLVIFYLI